MMKIQNIIYILLLISFNALSQIPQNLTIDNDTPPPYKAQISITANDFDLYEGENADFEAGKSITLNHGFWGRQGCVFSSKINQNLLPFIIADRSENHIIVYKPKTEVNSTSYYNNLSIEQLSVGITYFDGLGRDIQQISLHASPTKNDIIQHIEYDELGRNDRNYLPFTAEQYGSFLSNARTTQETFYQNPPSGVVSDDYAYTQKHYDESPLKKVIEEVPCGVNWQSNTSRHNQYLNESDDIILWKIDETSNYAYADLYYPANSLYVSETIDEDGHKELEFKDNFDNMVLKRVYLSETEFYNTYFVYDNKNRLRFTIPPKAVNLLNSAGYNTQNLNEDLIYWYIYDGEDRLIKKKIPGMDEPSYMVYNKIDQLILTQDANMRHDNEGSKWMFIKYDVMGRPVITGIYTEDEGVLTSQESMQALINSFQHASEKRTSLNYSTQFGYTNNVFPTQNIEILAVNYYDDYDFNYNGNADYQYLVDTDFPNNNPADKVNGLSTGTFVKNLATNEWIKSVVFYNNKNRIIQTREYNSNIYDDINTNEHDFAGRLIKTKQTFIYHGTSDETTSICKIYDYDHADRLIKVYHKINDQQPVLMVENEYNEIGELIEKNLHSTDDGSNFAQSVDYEYNIRGWLTKINEPSLAASDDNDLFGMELKYEDVGELGPLFATPVFNGNISAFTWEGNQFPGQKGFMFKFDNVNRLKQSTYIEKPSSLWVVRNYYNSDNISYDEMGNITHLDRKGFVPVKGKYGEVEGSYGIIDNLDYLYDGNQLRVVNDNSGNQEQGFKDLDPNNTAIDEYYYDKNGNMNRDINKNIVVNYNYLNLPQTINFGNNAQLNFQYDAGGKKVAKLSNDGYTVTTTNYCNNFIYQNDVLDYIITDEGRIVKNGSDYEYQYFLKDHLGNTRASFKQEGGTTVLLQENHYYPFGMELGGLSFVSDKENKYLYNGKEKQDEFGLDWFDYGARMYDAAVGRWFVVDPMTHLRSWVSPYSYCQNDPINRTDPTGALDDEWLYNTETGEMTWQSDLGGNEVQFVNFATPHENGGMVAEGTAVIEGPEVYAGPIRGGWGASSADYWSEIPDNCNVNSIDYLKGGNYEYSMLDLKKRYQVFNNPKLSDYQSTIAGWEASGNAQPIHGIEFRRQYTAKWETDKSFWFAIEAGYWNPADVGTMLDDGLKYLKNFRQTQRAFKYTPMYPALSPGKVSGNPWNQFLRETKGTYSGKDWLMKASDDYKLWKQSKGL